MSDSRYPANDAFTPLHMAMRPGYLQAAELLLAKGADVNARTGSCETALHLAVLHGQLQMAELLLSNGAEVNARRADGLTPLHLTADVNVRDHKNHRLVTELLLARGAEIDARSKEA